jgi:hypothetical protein
MPMKRSKEVFIETTRVCTHCGFRYDDPNDVQAIDLWDNCRICYAMKRESME